METPSATAGIRGTDWQLEVDAVTGRSTLIVLAGEVDFANAFGRVTVIRGEVAMAEIGQPPTKTILLNPKDRPQWELVITPDWLRIIPVTGMSTGELKAARVRMRAAPPTPAAQLDLAEVVYELSEYDEARRLVSAASAAIRPTDAGQVARARLLEAQLAASQNRFDQADGLLATALADLEGRRRFIAVLVRQQILAAKQRYAEVETGLATLARDYPQYAEVELLRILLTTFRGELRRAIEQAEAGWKRFPMDSRFPVWLAHLHLLLDEPQKMKAAIDAAIAVDPEQFLAWQFLGAYHHFVRPDAAASLAAYRRSLEIYPNYAPTWNNLGLVHIDLGDYDTARDAILRAMRLAPQDALYKATYAALLIAVLDRLDEGTTVLNEALALDSTSADALLLRGNLALRQGRPEEAVEWMLKATVVNPGLAGATTSLGIAYYQAGQFDAAEKTIDTALRLDPYDPVPALIGSIMAQDQAEAGKGIRLAREALQRYESFPNFAVENLAKSQSGIVNMGSAYANLNLNAWGQYYGQLSFNPSWATSHLFLANQYDSLEARRAEATQGLLLDPLAVSARNRYYDFVNQPFNDLTLGAGIGSEERAITNTQFATLQGFARLPTPVAYFINGSRVQSEGFRTNSAVTTETGLAAVGAKIDEQHYLLASLGGSRLRQGLPGPIDNVDEDDRITTWNVNGSLGYHYRAGPTNHVLVRVFASHTDSQFLNDDPFGVGLSDRSVSLIRGFGLATTRQLYDGGLCDVTTSSAVPTFVFGPQCLASGQRLPSDVPAGIDLHAVGKFDSALTSAQLHFRHLLDVGPVRATYGAEWSPSRLDVTSRTAVFQPTGTGTLLAPGGTFAFPFGTTGLNADSFARDRQAVVGYVDGDWEPVRALRVESGLFLRYFDDGADVQNVSLDPRAGVAWRVTPGHWLRAAGQRNQVLPIVQSLAPVATVGLAPRDDFTIEGGSVTDYTLRWDGEWTPRFFTFASAEQQRISKFFVPIDRSIDAIRVANGRINSVSAGANAWVGERWGLFAQHRWIWTENLGKSADRGNDLPLVPERLLDLGVTWVHPWQIRASALLSYVGERAADTANTSDLHSYWTASAQVSWQPWRKRWAFTLAAQNLLDAKFEDARGFRHPGLSVSLAAEYRFGN